MANEFGKVRERKERKPHPDNYIYELTDYQLYKEKNALEYKSNSIRHELKLMEKLQNKVRMELGARNLTDIKVCCNLCKSHSPKTGLCAKNGLLMNNIDTYSCPYYRTDKVKLRKLKANMTNIMVDVKKEG